MWNTTGKGHLTLLTFYHELKNSLVPYLKFIFENLSRCFMFNKKWSTYVSYSNLGICSLTCGKRCHPQYTKYNTALLLAQRVIRKVSDNNKHHLSKLNFFLIKRGQPEEVPDYTITKPFSASFESLSLFTISPY